jgi:2-keto-4-pentenoate hydratase/2-oxohepta-3-ene-1,7-dioic acid hydratase in catechol pathway
MRLATFEVNGRESWGVVVNHPAHNEDWIFEPALVEEKFKIYSSQTSSYFYQTPKFLKSGEWPKDLVSFLELEDEGMTALKQLNDFLIKFLSVSDQALLKNAGYSRNAVTLKAPIPRPRLFWGLVQNCPTFIRNDPFRKIVNLFPQGHQRPQGSVIGADETMVIPKDALPWGYNVEFGIIIGKKGRYIAADKAMDYVAGFTAVTDACIAGYNHSIDKVCKGKANIGAEDWFMGATASWGGKKSDTMCPMGPYLVTKDDVSNPYDLLVYTKKSGLLRDRAHTGALLLGFERTLEWYTSFATVFPGDVIHLATIGVDGMPCPEDMEFEPDDRIESEIERVGHLSNKVVVVGSNDWRDKDDPTKKIHASPAVRALIKNGEDNIKSIKDWNIRRAGHFWTVFGNYKNVAKNTNFKMLPHPRFLNGPNSALSVSPAKVELTPRATTLHLGIELALVIKKVASKIKSDKADDYILGYTPLVSVSDHSFQEDVVEPATHQERNIPYVYARWADGYNVILDQPVKRKSGEIRNLAMSLEIDGVGKVKGSLDEYVVSAPKVLELITKFITLFPGDVVTLGRVSERIEIGAKEAARKKIKGKGEIKSLGTIELSFHKLQKAYLNTERKVIL